MKSLERQIAEKSFRKCTIAESERNIGYGFPIELWANIFVRSEDVLINNARTLILQQIQDDLGAEDLWNACRVR